MPEQTRLTTVKTYLRTLKPESFDAPEVQKAIVGSGPMIDLSIGDLTPEAREAKGRYILVDVPPAYLKDSALLVAFKSAVREFARAEKVDNQAFKHQPESVDAMEQRFFHDRSGTRMLESKLHDLIPLTREIVARTGEPEPLLTAKELQPLLAKFEAQIGQAPEPSIG